MGLIASDKGGGDFELTEEGVHLAICYGVIDLGHQHNAEYDKDVHKILIMWELPNLRIDIEKDGETTDKPRGISRRFTLSLGEKSHLRPFLESWRSKKFTGLELAGFDITKLIGVNCQLQVLHNTRDGKTYANVHAVLPSVKGTPPSVPENPTIYFSIEDSGLKLPDNLPEWIEKVIMKSREWTDQGMSEMNTYPDDHGSEEPPIHGYEEEPDREPIPF
jgi:hypothetical protein